jgi:adenosylcobinamide kinase/adenosylcobinamide-phosphate guanylyltransferase
MSELILVLGGTKSGKSRYALRRAQQLGGDAVTFVATARRGDPELDRRIARHEAERPTLWRTIEADIDLAGALAAVDDTHVVLLDSLTLWVSLVLDLPDRDLRWTAARKRVVERSRPVVVVSEESGLGIIPEHAMARRFLDVLGVCDQELAVLATEVWLMVAGIPVPLKARV